MLLDRKNILTSSAVESGLQNDARVTPRAGKGRAAALFCSPPDVVLSLLCVLYFLLFVDRVNISAVAPVIKSSLKLSNSRMGLVFSAFAVPYAVFQLIGGWVGDRLGPRLALSLCCIVVSLTTILTGFAGGFSSLFGLRLALGFGEGAAFPTATRAMSRWTAPERWGFAQGITHSFSRIGNAITPPLMAALLVVMSWRWSFVLLGLASLGWVVVWAWYFRDDPRDHPLIRPGDLALLHAAGGRRVSVPWWQLARRIAPLTLVDFCYGWTLWLFLTWIPSFFAENYHLNLRSSSWFAAGVLFAGVIGDAAGGVISDRIYRATGDRRLARVRVIQAGFLGAFVFLIPVVLIRDLRVAAACLSAAFFFAELIVGPIWSIPMDIAPRYAGTASGMMNFGFGVAGLVSPSTLGYLVDLTGSWVLPFLCSIALLFVGAVLAERIRPDLPFGEQRMQV
jgi:MFS family permease